MLEKYRIINPLADGNCAYNAIALAFVDLVLLGKLDEAAKQGRFALLLSELSKINASITDWEAFKKYLNENRDKPALIQSNLARVFRKIVVDLKENEFKRVGHKNKSEIKVFLAEFREHVLKQYSIPCDEGGFIGGDIYCEIPKIVAKFEEETQIIDKAIEDLDLFKLALAYEAFNSNQELTEEQTKYHDTLENALKERYKQLKEWFINSGYQIYLDFIKTPTNWVGDLELATLSAHLGINTKACRPGKKKFYEIYNPHGYLPTNFLKPEQIDLLKERGIINKKGDTQDLEIQEIVDKEKLTRRLNDIKNLKIVSDYWFNNFTDEKKIPVPSEWIPDNKRSQNQMEANNLFNNEDFAELIERGIINIDQTGKYVFFQLTAEEFIKKTNGVENSESIIEQLLKNYENPPDVCLSNPQATHWYYYQPREYKHWDLSKLAVEDSRKLISQAELYDCLTKALDALAETHDSKKNKSNGTAQFDVGIEDNNDDDDDDLDESEEIFGFEEDDELETQLTFDEDARFEEEDSNTELEGGTGEDLQITRLKNVIGLITQAQSPRSRSPENDFIPSAAEISGFHPMSSDGPSDSVVKFNISTSSLPAFSNITKRKVEKSTSPSPLSSSPNFWNTKPNSPTPTAPPPKKKLREKEESQMQILAVRARDSLTKIKSENQETLTAIRELTVIFNNIIKENQILEKNSLQLLTPHFYLPVTDEILEFRSRNLNQILCKAYSLLHIKVKYLYLEIANKGCDTEESPTISLLNSIFKASGQSTSFEKDLQVTITNFDLCEVDNIPPDFHDLIEQIKSFIELCKRVIENTNSRACANSILSIGVINNNEYAIIKKNFLAASEDDIDSLDSTTLGQILSIHPEKNIKNDELARAVKEFIDLYQKDILDVLKRTLGNTP